MNIGIDIDGVLTDLQKATIDYGTKMCVDENWPIKIDLNEYDEAKKFNWTEEQEEKFWNKYLVKYVTESPTREFVPEIIEKLQQEGNTIYLITARAEDGMETEHDGQMKQLTKQWLASKNIKYEKIIFAKNKLPHCIENNIDIMIEDSPQNILQLSEKIKVIKFDCEYNKHVDGENIYTAYSWYHIYKIIKEIEKGIAC